MKRILTTLLAASIIAIIGCKKNDMNTLKENQATTLTQQTNSTNPLVSKAVEYIRKCGIDKLPRERVELENGDIIFNGVVDATLKPRDKAFLEAHRKYIDLQVIISGTDSFGLKNTADCKNVKSAYNPQKDVEFFSDEYAKIETVKAGQIIILPPETAHAPCVGQGTVVKAVFKIIAAK